VIDELALRMEGIGAIPGPSKLAGQECPGYSNTISPITAASKRGRVTCGDM